MTVSYLPAKILFVERETKRMSDPRVICYRTPINMRLSENSLAELVHQSGHKLNGGDVFIFFNSKRDRCKVVWHDGRSYNCIEKMLHAGTFADSPEVTDRALKNLLSGGLFGSREVMNAISKGGKIIHISAAPSARKDFHA
jgi:hypothetical protein